jgi:signal transduction histidine kinase/CheY-like chemotaxis protein
VAATDVVLMLTGTLLVALSVFQLGVEWRRGPGLHRAETLLVVVVLGAFALAPDQVRAAAGWHPALGSLLTLILLGQPYLLLRLARRCHDVPDAVTWLSMAIAIAAAVVQQSVAASADWALALSLYSIVAFACCAWIFSDAARLASGVARTRLTLIAAGVWLSAAMAGLYAVDAVRPLGPLTVSMARLLGVSALGCYYAGLVGARWLRTVWGRTSISDYLVTATQPGALSAEGRDAALVTAAGAAVSTAARAVLLFDHHAGGLLTARAAHPAAWRELRMAPGVGLVGRALASGRAAAGAPHECEPDLAALASVAGAHVLVLPICGADHAWGVLAVVQPHGSLFPAGDADVLTTLCRHYAAMLDYAAREEAARELDRAALNHRLRRAQRMEALGQLAGGIAHDFGNLLVAAEAYVSSLEASPNLEPDSRESLAGVRSVVRRAADLTGHLLAFSRQQDVQVRPINLADVISDLLPTLERVLEKRVEVSFAGCAMPLRVLADSIQLEQIALNLAVNARDAMPEGGRLTICATGVEITSSRRHGTQELAPGHYARLTVSDTGAGMDAETQARIFEPFFTTKPIGHGTGLGLSTVHEIVTQLGGVIGVESAPGCGSTFDIYLPLAASAGEGTDAEPADLPAAGGSETILVVEDHPVFRQQLVEWLARRGYTVFDSDSPADAQMQFDLERIDLMVTDVILPGGTGTELAGALQQQRPGLAVLFVSGYAFETLIEHSLLPVGAPFLQKPLSETHLLSTIRQILDARPRVDRSSNPSRT